MKKDTFDIGIKLYGCDVLLFIEAETLKQQIEKHDRVVKWFEKHFEDMSIIKTHVKGVNRRH